MADKLMQATQPFTCVVGGVPYSVGAGDVFGDGDEVVRAHPGYFTPVAVRDSSTIRRPLPRHPGAETASAAPGELRTVTHPPQERPPRKKATTAAAAAPTDGPSEV